MPDHVICPYCNVKIHLSNQPQFSIDIRMWGIHLQKTFNTVISAREVTCEFLFCHSHGKKYKYFFMEDFSVIAKSEMYSDKDLESLKTITGCESFDDIFKDIKGVTALKNQLHICVQVGKNRVVIACTKDGQCISVIDITKVY